MAARAETDRWLALEGAVNARDVGGLRFAGGGRVASRRLLRSDNLQGLTPRDVEALVDELGVTAVVDLRTGVERELEGPGPLSGRRGVEIRHLSLYPEAGDQTDVDAEAIKVWGANGHHPGDADETPTVQAYLGYLRRRPDSVVAAIRTIAAPPGDGAVIVHCAAGKDRTGVVVALALEAAGIAREEIVEDYLATAARIEQVIGRLAASPTYRRDLDTSDPTAHAPREGTMERVLELLDRRHGGPLGWLGEHGLTDADVVALRARLR